MILKQLNDFIKNHIVVIIVLTLFFFSPTQLIILEYTVAQERSRTKVQRSTVSNQPARATNQRTSRWPVFGESYTSKTVSQAEKEFVKAFADEINFATAVVAANPSVSFPAHSLAEKIRKSYIGFNPSRHGVYKDRAVALLLTEEPAERQRYFGSYAGSRAAAEQKLQGPFLDRAMQDKLRKAVRARLDAQRAELKSLFEQTAKGSFPMLPKTWLEAGFLKKDIVQSTGQKIITMNQPEQIDFKWKTEVDGTEQGFWQILRMPPEGGSKFQKAPIPVASGYTGGTTGGTFEIDFREHVPPQPTDVPIIYHVQIQPWKKTTAQSAGSRDSKAGMSKGGKKSAASSLGLWSAPVVINYVDGTWEGPDFDVLLDREVYRELTFHLDRIMMKEDQTGAGDEEFHVVGFAQESLPSSSAKKGKLEKFGPYKKVLCPEPGQLCSAAVYNIKRGPFILNNPDQPEWPRAFTVLLSVMEEDDGGSLAEWQSEIWDISDDMLEGEIADLVGDYLEEFKDELIGQGIHIGAEIVQTLISAISSAIAGAISAGVAAAAVVIVAIIIEKEDDFYGADYYTFLLPTNLTSFVHGLPGQHSGSDKYMLKQGDMPFYGMPLTGIAGGWDGKVVIYYHWEFSKKQQF